MDKEIIQTMKNQLDSLAQIIQEKNIEFWFARDLQELLGYMRWENFITAIKRSIESCKSTGCKSSFIGRLRNLDLSDSTANV